MPGSNPYGMRAMARNPYPKANQFPQYARPPYTPPQLSELGSNQALVPNLRGSSSHSWSEPPNPITGGSMQPDNDTRYHNSLPPDFRQSHLQHSAPMEQINHQPSQAQADRTVAEQNYHASTSFPMQSSQTINPAPFKRNFSNDIDKDNGDDDENDDYDDDEMDESDETTSDTGDEDGNDDELSSNDEMNLGIRKMRGEGNKNNLYYYIKHKLLVYRQNSLLYFMFKVLPWLLTLFHSPLMVSTNGFFELVFTKSMKEELDFIWSHF